MVTFARFYAAHVLLLPPLTMLLVAIHLYLEDVDAVYQRALEAGAISMHPVVDLEYRERSGGVKDTFGNHWYIATHKGAS